MQFECHVNFTAVLVLLNKSTISLHNYNIIKYKNVFTSFFYYRSKSFGYFCTTVPTSYILQFNLHLFVFFIV